MRSYQDYLLHLTDSEIRPRFRVQFLNPDESVYSDVTQDIVDDNGSITINYNQGVRRSCNITLYNVDRKYIPSENSVLWVNGKFKVYLGMEINGEIYWQSQGVYVFQNPEVYHNFSDKRVSISGVDKFAKLNGDLGGEIDEIYQIELGSKVHDVIKSILAFDNGNGYKLDPIEPILDSQFKDSTLPYTIRKEPGENLGSIIIEIANAFSCDVYYDCEGRLRFESGIADLASVNKPSLFSYDVTGKEYLDSSISYQWDKVYSVCRVIGDNVSGDIATGLAENTNPLSPTRIARIGRRVKVIKSDIIQTDDLAKQLADYSLKKISIIQSLLKFQSTFMVHLDVDNVIEITDDYYGFQNQRFLIQSLTIPLSVGSRISLDVANIRDLPYYTTD